MSKRYFKYNFFFSFYGFSELTYIFFLVEENERMRLETKRINSAVDITEFRRKCFFPVFSHHEKPPFQIISERRVSAYFTLVKCSCGKPKIIKIKGFI